jgi:hypothetical protein
MPLKLERSGVVKLLMAAFDGGKAFNLTRTRRQETQSQVTAVFREDLNN